MRRLAALMAITVPAAMANCPGGRIERSSCFDRSNGFCSHPKTSCTILGSCVLESDFIGLWATDVETLRNVEFTGCVTGPGFDYTLDIILDGKTLEYINARFVIGNGVLVDVDSLVVPALTIGDDAEVTTSGSFGCDRGYLSIGERAKVNTRTVIQPEAVFVLPNKSYFGRDSVSRWGLTEFRYLVSEDSNLPSAAAASTAIEMVVGVNAHVEIDNFENFVYDGDMSTPSSKYVNGIEIEIRKLGKFVYHGQPIHFGAGSLSLREDAEASFSLNGRGDGTFRHNTGMTITLGKGATLHLHSLRLCGGLIVLEEGSVLIVDSRFIICEDSIIQGPGQVLYNGVLYHDSKNGFPELTIRDGAQVHCSMIEESTAFVLQTQGSIHVMGDLVARPQDFKMYDGAQLVVDGALTMVGGSFVMHEDAQLTTGHGSTLDLISLTLREGASLLMESSTIVVEKWLTMDDSATLNTTGFVKAAQLNVGKHTYMGATALETTVDSPLKQGTHLHFSERATIRSNAEKGIVVHTGSMFTGGIFELHFQSIVIMNQFKATAALQVYLASNRDLTVARDAEISLLDVKEGGTTIDVQSNSIIETIILHDDTKNLKIPAAFADNTEFVYQGSTSNKMLMVTWLCGLENGRPSQAYSTIDIVDGQIIFPMRTSTAMEICAGKGDGTGGNRTNLGVLAGSTLPPTDRDTAAMYVGVALGLLILFVGLPVFIFVLWGQRIKEWYYLYRFKSLKGETLEGYVNAEVVMPIDVESVTTNVTTTPLSRTRTMSDILPRPPSPPNSERESTYLSVQHVVDGKDPRMYTNLADEKPSGGRNVVLDRSTARMVPALQHVSNNLAGPRPSSSTSSSVVSATLEYTGDNNSTFDNSSVHVVTPFSTFPIASKAANHQSEDLPAFQGATPPPRHLHQEGDSKYGVPMLSIRRGIRALSPP